MPTDYNQGGTMYAQSMITGVNNSQAIVFGADGTLKFVTSPFGASPVEAISISSAGVVNIAGEITTAPDGSAAAPSISFTGHTTDGLYSTGSGHVNVTIAGVALSDLSASGETLKASGLYRWSSTADPTATADLILGRNAAASLRLGAADAASAVAQTLGVQGVVTGTTDTAGADFSIAGSTGTGTGAGGSLLFKLAAAGSTGTTPNALASQASLTSAGTLNLLLNASLLRFGASSDVILGRQAAASLRLGAADAASPVAQALGVQSVVAGTTDTAGANLALTGSQGTGTGVGGDILVKVAYPGTTASTQNALVTVLTVSGANKQASGTGLMAAWAPVVNQSGTAAYTALDVNVTETATGSGAKLLMNLRVGGTTKFSVSNAGVLTSGAATGLTTTYVVRCEAANDKVRTITLTGGLTTDIGTCA